MDGSRTAVWGWSYGGYASGMILANDNEGIFKCGISVAPVTDWTLYGMYQSLVLPPLTMLFQIPYTPKDLWVFLPLRIIL